MKERGQKAYDALVKAFFEGTLAKGTCACCAVGNIVASYHGIEIPGNLWDDRRLHESMAIDIVTIWGGFICNPAAGYSAYEISLIEAAFEGATEIRWEQYKRRSESEIIADQYNGLCAVFDVLVRLDGGDAAPMKEILRTHPKLASL